MFEWGDLIRKLDDEGTEGIVGKAVRMDDGFKVDEGSKEDKLFA